MCQTQVIRNRIGSIGRRSFDRRMRIASPQFVEKRGEVARLLNEIDRLSEMLHSDFATITEEDYLQFGAELKIVIATLKALRRESLSHSSLRRYDERMRQQIVDLEELDHDIKVFRVDAPRNSELQATMSMLDSIDLSKCFKWQ